MYFQMKFYLGFFYSIVFKQHKPRLINTDSSIRGQGFEKCKDKSLTEGLN